MTKNKLLLALMFCASFQATTFAAKDIPAARDDGPGSSGGGNGYRGRPIESYITDITRLPEYRQHVEPAIAAIEKKVPSLGRDLRNVANFKNWYVLDVRLPNIPKDRLGVYFQTDQMALQSRKAVWIDSLLFRSTNMSDLDRGTLIMHELVMGVKLSSLFEKGVSCIECTLNGYEYETVRNLTYILLNKQDQFSAQDIINILNEGNFGRYLLPPAPVDFSNIKNLTVGDLYLILRSEKTNRSLPGMNQCAYEFNHDSKSNSLNVKIYHTNGQGAALLDYVPAQIKMTEAPTMVDPENPNNRTLVYTYSTGVYTYSSDRKVMAIADPAAAPAMDDFRRQITISFGQDRIGQIRINWERFIYDYRQRKYLWVKVNEGPRGSYEPIEKTCN
jgi:hypothetical protein